jgi:hypothetical protein
LASQQVLFYAWLSDYTPAFYHAKPDMPCCPQNESPSGTTYFAYFIV